jgi:hypothetical protein
MKVINSRDDFQNKKNLKKANNKYTMFEFDNKVREILFLRT